MPQRPSCCCPQHAVWGHAENLQPRTCFWGVNLDGWHNNRKKKICLSFGHRIKLENECDELQVWWSVSWSFLQKKRLVIIFWIWNLQCKDEGVDIPTLVTSFPFFANNNFPPCLSIFRKLVFSDAAEDLQCDGQTQTDAVLLTSQGIQVGEFPIWPSQLYETRKKSEIRTEVNERIHDLLNLYVQSDESALHDLLDDLRLSKKWSSNFGILPNCKGDLTVHDKMLHSIVKEYKDCKNKEVNSVIRKQAKKMTQAINISGTLSKSEVAFLQVCIVLSHWWCLLLW